jgi:hypothetical protein
MSININGFAANTGLQSGVRDQAFSLFDVNNSALAGLDPVQLKSLAGMFLTPVEQGILARLGDILAQSTAPTTVKAPVATTTEAGPKTVKGAKTIDDFNLSNATAQDKADFKAALAYLQAADAKGNAISPTAVKLLAKVPDGAKINITTDLNAFYDPSAKAITWNPRAAGDLANGKMSPAMVLAHEIDHMVAGQKNPKATGDNYDNTEEKRVITGTETKIARELGEPSRKDHRGGLVLVGSSTEHTPVNYRRTGGPR